MTERPYTDDDLRTEAAHQHKAATEDPEFSGIGEQMEGHKIPSRGDFQWDQLSDDDFDLAMRTVDNLLGNAADVSRWAIHLGADGLEPCNEHAINLSETDDKPFCRIHFAFEPGMPDSERAELVHRLMQVIANSMTT